MRRMNKTEFETQIINQFCAPMLGDKAYVKPEQIVAEANWYIIRPLAWYMRTPWFGFKKFTYVADGFDCYHFMVEQFAYWNERNWKRIATSGPGSAPGPALPTVRLKYFDDEIGKNHWSCGVLTSEGWRCIDRKSDGSVILRRLPVLPLKVEP